MRFIQCSHHHSETNLHVVQHEGDMYHCAFKNIRAGQELILWYDDKYPHYYGLPYDTLHMSSTAIGNKEG